MATSRISPRITETGYSHLTKTNFWTSCNTKYHCCGTESLLYKDLIQWTKACKRKRKAEDSTPTTPT
eukprot:1235351-Ditylum_brightwellii.AAC.1